MSIQWKTKCNDKERLVMYTDTHICHSHWIKKDGQVYDDEQKIYSYVYI